MAVYHIEDTKGNKLWLGGESDFEEAKKECDRYAVRFGIVCVVVKLETVYSSQTLDDLLKETE